MISWLWGFAYPGAHSAGLFCSIYCNTMSPRPAIFSYNGSTHTLYVYYSKLIPPTLSCIQSEKSTIMFPYVSSCFQNHPPR